MAQIAFIGLGNMGGPMALNLVKAGHSVRGFDLSDAAKALAKEGGVEVVESIAEAVEGAEAVITSLPKGDHVRSVLDGPDGIWAHAPQSALLLDTSTVDVETSQWCHDQSAERGFSFADTPVSGGTVGAAAGTLAVMIGGDDDAAQRAAEYVKPFAGNAIVAGGPTAGIAAKLTNNMMLFIESIAVNEGAVLADRLGLDPKVFWDIVSVSSGRCWAQQTWYPVPGVIESAAANKNFDATFRADLALKDITLAVDAADKHSLNIPAGKLAKAQFEQLVEEGYGDKDCMLTVKNVSPDGSAKGWDGAAPSSK